MTYDELVLLQRHFGEEKTFVEDGYYRLRQKDETTYELAYLKSDTCGTTTANPQITVTVEGTKIKPVGLIDLFEVPTRNIAYSKETATDLEQSLDRLVAKFKGVKGLV